MKWSKMGVPKSKGGMGFRDFNFFNKALLAKQCWRLWRSPDSLVSQILRAKYYAHNSILEAKLGKNPSYAWRSILGHAIFLREGSSARLAMGKPQESGVTDGFRSQQPILSNQFLGGLDGEAKVVELIDKDRLAWDK
jgi:hypothetical protein